MEELKTDRLSTQIFNPKLTFGEIEITEYLLNEISILSFNGKINEHGELDWKLGKEGIFMCFNFAGKIKWQEKKRRKDIEFMENQHNIFYSKAINGRLIVEPSPLKTLIIQLPERPFREIVSKGNYAIEKFFNRITGENTVAFSDQNPSIDLLLQTCINAMLHCNYEDSLKKMFLFSKVIELFVLQMESFKKLGEAEKRYITTDYDRERILYAREYLLKNLAGPPSLKQLARMAGINEFKLKKGFKELFNQTVFEYLSDVRLEVGKNDLLEKKKTISEIAFDLGYSSLQHFSTAFKRKFGIPPNQVR